MISTAFKRSSKFWALLPVLFAVAPVCPASSLEVAPAPIEVRAAIPPEDAGIINHARVPDETGFAVLIRAAYGLDARSQDAVRFIIDDGLHLPYRRDLSFDTVRVVKLDQSPDNRATFLWVVYDRFLEPLMPTSYPPETIIRIEVEIKDIANNILQPEPFEFKIESDAGKAASRQNLPKTLEFHTAYQLPENVYDTVIKVTEGKLYGAKVICSSNEPLTPQFGSPDAIEEMDLQGVRAAGAPANLVPHTVFDTPVRLFLPVSEDADIRSVGLAYYDGTQWVAAADAGGNVLPGAEGWMVPGSRINHKRSSPPLIEVQVHHFSGAQAVVFGSFDGIDDEEQDKENAGNADVVVFASCFITSASSDAGLSFWSLSLAAAIVILLGARCQAMKKSRMCEIEGKTNLASDSSHKIQGSY